MHVRVCVCVYIYMSEEEHSGSGGSGGEEADSMWVEIVLQRHPFQHVLASLAIPLAALRGGPDASLAAPGGATRERERARARGGGGGRERRWVALSLSLSSEG
jgi:hypothetical protein